MEVIYLRYRVLLGCNKVTVLDYKLLSNTIHDHTVLYRSPSHAIQIDLRRHRRY
jgi:hypothetical protein